MRYEAPETLDSAVALLGGKVGDGGVHVLNGGTDLLVRLRSGMTEPDLVVDIKRIAGLKQITAAEGGGWRIGAAVPSAEMSAHEGLVTDWPGVVEAAALIGSTQIQGRATLAGNLCNASPAADSVPAMIAAGAVAELAGPGGIREVAVADIPEGPGRTCLKPGEFVAAIRLPAQAPRAADAYLRFIPRTEMDIAVVGCGIWLSLGETGRIDAARVALGAVGPKIIEASAAADALKGSALDDAALDGLAAACSAAAQPIDDKRGTVAFRRHVSGVLARRAARIAYDRAQARKGGTA